MTILGRHRTLLGTSRLPPPPLPPPPPRDDPGPPPPCWLCGTIMALHPASIQWWCHGCDVGTGLRPGPDGPLTQRVTVAMGDGYNPPRMTVTAIDHSAVHAPSPA